MTTMVDIYSMLTRYHARVYMLYPMLTRTLSSRHDDPHVIDEETGTERVSDLPRSPS